MEFPRPHFKRSNLWPGTMNGSPTLPVAQRRRNAQKKMDALRRKAKISSPSSSKSRKIANSFWGTAWWDHWNRSATLPTACPADAPTSATVPFVAFAIDKGKIEAKVSGSELYTVNIAIETLPPRSGTMSSSVRRARSSWLVATAARQSSRSGHGGSYRPAQRLVPLAGRNSPSSAVAGLRDDVQSAWRPCFMASARLDHKPELLFKLRGVDHEELIAADAEAAVAAATTSGKSKHLATETLSDVFGIELAEAPEQEAVPAKVKKLTASRPSLAQEGSQNGQEGPKKPVVIAEPEAQTGGEADAEKAEWRRRVPPPQLVRELIGLYLDPVPPRSSALRSPCTRPSSRHWRPAPAVRRKAVGRRSPGR